MFSRDYPVAFRFYASYHPTSVLARTTGNPGMFCIVTSKLRQGVRQLDVTCNDMQTTESITITSEIETRLLANQYMGAHNALIIGCSLFDGPKAYDAQCPVCLRDKGGVNYPLTFIGDGQSVRCTKCLREYSLRAEGSPTDGQADGKPLLQYPIRVYDPYIEVKN